MTPKEYVASNRNSSALVKTLQNQAGLSNKDMAAALQIREETYVTKLYRNSFTFEQIQILIDICGCRLVIESK